MSMRVRVWIAFIISIFAIAYITATYEKPVCKKTVYASDVSRWLMTQHQFIRYDSGEWFDGKGRLIGTSATEDSDVCVK